jgi:hypothetical protein
MGYFVKANNKIITKRLTKQEAISAANNLKRQMKIAIPKYKWAKNIKVVRK